jgi:hypothetical protein
MVCSTESLDVVHPLVLLTEQTFLVVYMGGQVALLGGWNEIQWGMLERT